MSRLLIPNTTQVPNVLLDQVIPKLPPPGAVRVLLAIVRKTYGFQKFSDCISFSSLQKLTGLSREGVNTGIKKINEKFCSLLKITPGAKGKGASEYSLDLDVSTGQLVRKVDQSDILTSQSCGQKGSQKSRLSKTNKTKPIRRPHSGDAKSPPLLVIKQPWFSTVSYSPRSSNLSRTSLVGRMASCYPTCCGSIPRRRFKKRYGSFSRSRQIGWQGNQTIPSGPLPSVSLSYWQ